MTLEEILKAKGLSDDDVKSVIGEMKQNKIFTSSEENMDIRYNKLKGDFDNLTAQHGESTKLIEQLKAGTKDSEKLQGQITAYETQVNELQEQLKKAQLDAAVQVALLGAKVTDIDYMTFRLNEKGDLELGEDGKIKGIDDKIAGLKTQYPTFFESKTDDSLIDPNPLPRNNDPVGITKEQFNKMGYQSRLKLKQESPEVYAQMTGKETE